MRNRFPVRFGSRLAYAPRSTAVLWGSAAGFSRSHMVWVFFEISFFIITLHASALRNQNAPSCLHISLLQQQGMTVTVHASSFT